MATSPNDGAEGVVTHTLLSDGKQVDDTVALISITVVKRVNKVPYATLVVLDGEMPDQDFPVSNTDAFKPGKAIEIKAGYASDETTLFKGVVVRHGIKIDGANASRLEVECRDATVAMTVGRRNANYVDSLDSDVMSQLLGAYSGVTAKVEATDAKHGELVQYYCTDWDFVLLRAEANAMVVLVDDGEVSVAPPDGSTEPKLTVTYGHDIIEFEADIDARTRFRSVSAASWDPGQQAVVSSSAASKDVTEQGNLSSDDLADVVGLDAFRLQTVARADTPTLKAWSEGQQVKAALGSIRGRVRFQGSALATIGDVIELKGVGDRFNGKVFVGAVHHELRRGSWTTEVEFGLPDEWFAERRDLDAPPAAGLVPGVDGLQVGVVKKLADDPDGQARIQVSVPVLEAEDDGVWARLATFHGSEGIGEFFIPEIGDEVVLGYLNGDPANPVVLGSLYSGRHKPPYTLEDENNTKAIVTRSELRIVFDEEKKETTIITPAENKIVLSDDGKSILIEDQTGNKGEFSPSGIALSSPRDISIEAAGKISISATADVTVDGLNITNTAKVGFTAKGSATAELSAAGNTTVKGAMVMIN